MNSYEKMRRDNEGYVLQFRSALNRVDRRYKERLMDICKKQEKTPARQNALFIDLFCIEKNIDPGKIEIWDLEGDEIWQDLGIEFHARLAEMMEKERVKHGLLFNSEVTV